MYARTVNGVRKYFYDVIKDVDVEVAPVLPVDVQTPKYKHIGNHLGIIMSFAIFNTIYVMVAYVFLP